MSPTVTQMRELKSLYDGLNYENIYFGDYFRTLSAEGKRQKFMSEERFLEIKQEIGELLADIISDYTRNESTSIMKDTANDLFDSVLYVLDMSLFTFESHEEALAYIIDNSVFAAYQKGFKTVKQCIFEVISLVVKLKSNRINFSDLSYNKILDGEILSYLKKYNGKFFAHGTKRIFSYNSVNGCGGHRGILSLKKIVENLVFESGFVNGYGEDTVQQLCYGFCEMNGREYNDMGCNIYSVVLMNAVFARLCDKDGLEVLPEDAKNVARYLKKYPEFEQRRILYEATKEVSSERYVQTSMVKLAGHAINAIAKNELNKIIYIGEIK
ncbi:MAG: hypothetical protein IKU45_06120 [Clostridia bacterium]|nr:hypothetical protein [Clostridia bacterium]